MGDETHIVGSHELVDVGNAATSSSAAITSEAIRQIKAATDPLTRQLEKLCHLMKELKRDSSRRSEEIFGLSQGSAKLCGTGLTTFVFMFSMKLADFFFTCEKTLASSKFPFQC